MIKVSRLNGEGFYLNSEMIELIESTPDTIVSLMSGRKLVVRESPDEIIKGIISFRQKLYTKLPELK